MLSSAKAACIAALIGSAACSPVGLETRSNVQTTDGPVGVLTLETVADNSTQFASFNGQRDPNGFQILDLKPNGQPAPAQQFKIIYTSYYGKGVNGNYGILQSVRTPSRCIAANALQTTNARFIAIVDMFPSSFGIGPVNRFPNREMLRNFVEPHSLGIVPLRKFRVTSKFSRKGNLNSRGGRVPFRDCCFRTLVSHRLNTNAEEEEEILAPFDPMTT